MRKERGGEHGHSIRFTHHHRIANGTTQVAEQVPFPLEPLVSAWKLASLESMLLFEHHLTHSIPGRHRRRQRDLAANNFQ